MQINDKIKVKGCSETGVIIDIFANRDKYKYSNKTTVTVFKVKLDNGKEYEYLGDEIKLI